MFTQLGASWQAARTRLELAETVASADPSAARTHLDEALAAFDALGARPDAERVRATLQTLA